MEAAPKPKHFVSLSERLYRLLLLSYPKKFRQIYGREMLLTFRDCRREALLQYGAQGIAHLWGFMLRDLAATVVIEHYKTFVTQWKRFLGLEEKEYATLFTPFKFSLNVGQRTDIGRQRKSNEDNMTTIIPEDPEVLGKRGALFVVSDGLGGHDKGEVASELAVRSISEAYYQDVDDNVEQSLRQAIQRANTAIHQRGNGMGTTCVVAVLQGDTVFVANVGDSRAYLIRDGQLKQISRDHSIVAEELRAGLITKEQARHHPQINIITRCLGAKDDVEVDTFAEPVQEGDLLLLCTDGLTNQLTDEELTKIVHELQPTESVQQLIERANEQGGPDNITAIVVQVASVA